MPDIEGWDARAKGWASNSSDFERHVAPLTEMMLHRAQLGEGQRVLELACGPGGLVPRVLDSIGPGGRLVATDIAPKMVEAAKAAHDAPNVDFMEMGIDWIDSPSGVADRILCRFGYMFATDPGVALHEARRVLKGGGLLVSGLWAEPERNPYGIAPFRALADVGLGAVPKAGDSGQFRLASPGQFKEMNLDAGFVEVNVDEVELQFKFDSLGDLLDWVFSQSQAVSVAMSQAGPDVQARFDDALESHVQPWTDATGSITLPGVALVVTAEA